ncbi:hypothetical protein H4R35_000164 [Dimargaris xerosporica]|nr:hypothetical protein H4R35_000164 [Dimargaris xerosporica]
MTTHSPVQTASCSVMALPVAQVPLLSPSPNDEGFALEADLSHEIKQDQVSHPKPDDSPERAEPVPELTPRPVVQTYEPPVVDHYVECPSDTPYRLLQEQCNMAPDPEPAACSSHSGVDDKVTANPHLSSPLSHNGPQPHLRFCPSPNSADSNVHRNIAPHSHGSRGRNRHTQGLGPPRMDRSRKYSEGNIRDLYKVRQSFRLSGNPHMTGASYASTRNSPTAPMNPSSPSPSPSHRYSVPYPTTQAGQSPTSHQAHSPAKVHTSDKATPAPNAQGDGRAEPWSQASHAAAIPPGAEHVLGFPGLVNQEKQMQPGGHPSQSLLHPAGARWGAPGQKTRSEDTVLGGDSGPTMHLSCDCYKDASTLRVEPKVYWDVTPNYWYLITTALALLCLASVIGVVYGGICFSYACHKYRICPAGLDMAHNGCDKLGIEGSTVMLAAGFICGVLFVYGVFKRRRLIRKKEESRKLGYYGKFVPS